MARQPRGGATTEGTDVGTRELARRVHPSRRPADDAVLIAEANALGLVSDREVREGQVRIRPASRRGTVSAVIVRGHEVGYAKRPAPGPTALHAGSPRSEPTMAQLGSLDLVPRRDPSAPSVQRQTHDAVDVGAAGIETGSAGRNDAVPRRPRPSLGSGAGPAAHRARRPTSDAGPAAVGAARGDAVHPPDLVPAPPTTAAVLRLLASDSSLRRAAQQADDRWGEACWIHGDLAAGHVIVADGAARPRPVRGREHRRRRRSGLGRGERDGEPRPAGLDLAGVRAGAE